MPRMNMPPGPGRPKGSENKSTSTLKETVARFVEDNSVKFGEWLSRIEQDEGPLEAFKRVEALLEYCLPKQARVDTTLSAPGGGPVEVKSTVEYVDK